MYPKFLIVMFICAYDIVM